MTRCDSCGRPISLNARICPHCGHRYRSLAPVILLIAAVLMFFVWWAYLSIDPMVF